MYYVYILKSVSGDSYYVGYTENLKRRLFEHKSGSNASTKKYKDLELVYFEEYKLADIALKREKFLKSGNGRRVLKLKGIV